ncbi:oxygen-dependent protoporphyrinogen oxidase [Sporothrix stenoceras]|uniref:Oxygen-dependent protoporphyrinogen oxidase n=1 Tax=Sporothrix stenoceras TaxID=5173 RepID=A0ABR3Z162_9PEZI
MGPRSRACAAAAARTALLRRQLLSGRRPHCCAAAAASSLSLSHHRRYASTSTSPPRPIPKNVAVIGGGLTGLTTAYYLSMLLPATSHITLYEGSRRTGGWIDSKSKSEATKTTMRDITETEITADPTDILEAGARMVAPQRNVARYDDLLLLELIDQLELHDELRVSSWKPAQYVYYPDHLVEVSFTSGKPDPLKDQFEGPLDMVNMVQKLKYWGEMAGWALLSLKRILSEPLFLRLIPPVMYYMMPSTQKAEKIHARMIAANKAPGRYPPPSDDESVGAYITRLCDGDRSMADNLLSAVMHGIYGGDVWKISVASSIMRNQWLGEALMPLFALYNRQAKIAELRQQMAEANGRARPEDHDDWPGQNDGLGGGIAGHPPLTEETLRMAKVYSRAKGRLALAMESDTALLTDIMARQRERYERWLAVAERKRGLPGYEGDAGDGLPREPSPVDTLFKMAMNSSTWTQIGFAKGFGTLTDALTQHLRRKPNVTICPGEPVTSLKYEAKQKQVRVVTPRTKDKDGEVYDRVVSTLSSPALFRLAGGSATANVNGNVNGQLPSLKDAHAVTIMVVNLHYAEPHLHAPYRGFGYLIPQAVPLEQNPEGALGVIFDSDRELGLRRLVDLDRLIPMDDAHYQQVREASIRQIDADGDAMMKAERTRGSKYTVMLGGHYWDSYRYPDDFPSEEEAVQMAEAVLQRHLSSSFGWGGTTMPRPIATRAKLCRECIPQHYVGHAKRMAELDADLRREFGGRLTVAGGSFTATGPGVLPSVRSAYDVALRVAGRGYLIPKSQSSKNSRHETDMAHVGDTGLARFADPSTERVLPYDKADLPLRFGNKMMYGRGYFYIKPSNKNKVPIRVS